MVRRSTQPPARREVRSVDRSQVAVSPESSLVQKRGVVRRSNDQTSLRTGSKPELLSASGLTPRLRGSHSPDVMSPFKTSLIVRVLLIDSKHTQVLGEREEYPLCCGHRSTGPRRLSLSVAPSPSSAARCPQRGSRRAQRLARGARDLLRLVGLSSARSRTQGSRRPRNTRRRS